MESGRSREVAKLDIATLVEISEMREEGEVRDARR